MEPQNGPASPVQGVGPGGWLAGLHLLTLVNFSIAQPIYSVLAPSPEFFIAHSSGLADVVALVVALSLLSTVPLMLVELLVVPLGPRVRRTLHVAIVFFLAGLTALPVVKKISDSQVPASLAACLIGVAAAVVYARYPLVRSLLTHLSAVSLVFPVVFLFGPGIRSLLGSQWQTADAPAAETPVVLIIFDMLPTTALLDEALEIDRHRYPHFAALANQAHWFRNATTVSHGTTMSVPAILTGRYPPSKLPPTVTSYPENLCTFLASSHPINAFETATTLCPQQEAPDAARFMTRFSGVLQDVTIAYLHIVLPGRARERLPNLGGQVAHFAQTEDSSDSRDSTPQQTYKRQRRVQQVTDFLSEVDRQPMALHLLHLALPHGIYQFRPSSSVYTSRNEIPGLNKHWGPWGPNPEHVNKARQRFLLQLMFTDQLLGRIIGHLKDLGIYDDTIFIVTSDHGASFRPGEHARAIEGATYKDIMYVPLLVKLPGQQSGVLSDRNAEIIDILPTIAEILGRDIPWTVEGISLFFQDSDNRKTKTAVMGTWSQRKLKYERRLFPAPEGGEFTTLEPLIRGLEYDPQSRWIHIPSERDDWLGIQVGELTERVKLRGRKNFLIRLDGEDPGLTAELAAGWITGEIEPPRNFDETSVELAIAVDGIIVAFTRTFADGSRRHVFAELLPEPAAPLRREQLEVVVLGPAGE